MASSKGQVSIPEEARGTKTPYRFIIDPENPGISSVGRMRPVRAQRLPHTVFYRSPSICPLAAIVVLVFRAPPYLALRFFITSISFRLLTPGGSPHSDGRTLVIPTIMSSLWSLSLLCAIACLHIHTVECIQCWECNSHYDRNCGDPFRNETFALTDCDQRDLEHLPNQKATVCRKIVQKVRDDYRFVRGCGWLSSEKEGPECFKRAGTFNVLIQYCSCDRDGCNSAPHTTIARWLTAVCSTGLLVLLAA